MATMTRCGGPDRNLGFDRLAGGAFAITANMIVSADDIALDIPGIQNVWVQGVGCATAPVSFGA
jgi:hypothetical protein